MAEYVLTATKTQARAGSFYDRIERFYDLTFKLNGYGRSLDQYLQAHPLPVFENARILDAGCGTGTLTLALLRTLKIPVKLTALDLSASVLATVFCFQRGSAESKDPDAYEEVDADPRQHQHEPQAPGPVRKGGLALTLYAHSLSTAFAVLFALAIGQAQVSGWVETVMLLLSGTNRLDFDVMPMQVMRATAVVLAAVAAAHLPVVARVLAGSPNALMKRH